MAQHGGFARANRHSPYDRRFGLLVMRLFRGNRFGFVDEGKHFGCDLPLQLTPRQRDVQPCCGSYFRNRPWWLVNFSGRFRSQAQQRSRRGFHQCQASVGTQKSAGSELLATATSLEVVLRPPAAHVTVPLAIEVAEISFTGAHQAGNASRVPNRHHRLSFLTERRTCLDVRGLRPPATLDGEPQRFGVKKPCDQVLCQTVICPPTVVVFRIHPIGE